MAYTDWKTPQTCASIDRGTTADWANPDNAKASDNAYASANVLKLVAYVDYLRATNFNFSSIPAGSTINGIEVRIEHYADAINRIHDETVCLRKTSGQIGDNKASASYWATSDEEITYGGEADTWSAGLVDTDIKNSDFGIDLSVGNANPDFSAFSYVDCISIRVYYTIPPPNTGATLPGLGSTEDRDNKQSWANPTNIQAEAGYTMCPVDAGIYSDWLRASDFGFTIPSAAVIDGIKVEINRRISVADAINDSSLRLVDASGTNVGDDKASGSYWSTGEAETAAYGGDADTWGASPTPAMVNDSDFGIRLSAANTSASWCTAYVYWVKITVYYTEAVAWEKALSDTMTISDSIVKAVGLNKADTAAIADALSKAFGMVKSSTLAIADSLSKAVGLNKSESVSISDSIAKTMGLVKAELVTIADTFTKAMDYVLSLADTVGITDSISKAISIVKADTMAIADAMTILIGGVAHILNLFDTVVITDSLEGVIRVKTYLKQAIARVQVKGMDIVRMQVKRMNIAKTHLFR